MRHEWTDEMARTLMDMRHAGANYGVIGEALGIPRKTVETKARGLRAKGWDIPKRVGGVEKAKDFTRVDYTVRTPWGSTWEVGGDAETTDPFVESMRADGWEVSPPQAHNPAR